jgi:hypothetical protein
MPAEAWMPTAESCGIGIPPTATPGEETPPFRSFRMKFQLDPAPSQGWNPSWRTALCVIS